MWEQTHTALVSGLGRDAVWAVGADVDHWHEWDLNLAYAKIDGAFRAGNSFVLKPKGGPRISIAVLRAEPLQGFTDLTTFPLARMYGIHDMRETADGLEITTAMRIEGPLTWLWRKLVGQQIADEAPAQLEALAERARRLSNDSRRERRA